MFLKNLQKKLGLENVTKIFQPSSIVQIEKEYVGRFKRQFGYMYTNAYLCNNCNGYKCNIFVDTLCVLIDFFTSFFLQK